MMNASLYGAVQEAKKHSQVGRIYGALGGTGGLLQEKLMDLRQVEEAVLQKLLYTPGSAIGSSRDALEAAEYEQMARILQKHSIGWVLCNGGNGTMDMCGKLYAACRAQAHEIGVLGIPKTVDNDLSETDHSPGFASAARYMAQSTAEVCADVKSLPIHVVVVEALGRNAGWITAASALARLSGQQGPDLIYCPERPFIEEEFLQDTARLLTRKKGIVVVASEGLTGPDGTPIVAPVYSEGRSVYYGDVSAHLAGLVIQKLGYKARSEKPGLLGRCSASLQSRVDREEAALAGQLACRSVLQGETGKMVAFRRLSSSPYKAEAFLVEIEKVMLTERKLPDAYINERGNGITQEYIDWCLPLLGEELPQLVSFR